MDKYDQAIRYLRKNAPRPASPKINIEVSAKGLNKKVTKAIDTVRPELKKDIERAVAYAAADMFAAMKAASFSAKVINPVTIANMPAVQRVMVMNPDDSPKLLQRLIDEVVKLGANEMKDEKKDAAEGSTESESKMVECLTKILEAVSAEKSKEVVIKNFDGFPVALPIATFKDANGGAVQVELESDGSVPVTVVSGGTGGGGNGAILDGVDSAIKATVKDLSNSNPLTVAIVDGSGDQISSFGGGTQYTEGDTDATITGTAALVEGAANALAVLTQPLTDTQLRASDVKITLDGETVPVTGTFWQATQPVSASSLPLPTGASTLAEQQSQTTHLSTIAGDTTNIETSVQLLDDTVYTDGTGTVTKGIAVLGQDGTNPQAIKTDSSGELQVDVLTMPTVTVSATNLDIRDLTSTDVVTVTGGAGQTADVKITLDSEVVPVTDNSGSLTVDAPVGTPVFVRLSDGASAISTLPVSLSSVPSHAVTNAGTFVVQENGAALTSLQLIDDAIYTDGTGTVTKGVAILGQDGTNPQAIKTDASGELQVDVLTMPTVTVTATDLDIRNLVFATDKVDVSGSTLAANSGVDIGDVTINNASGASAVNIQDGGNSITVDGTVAVSGTVSVAGAVAHDAVDSGNPIKIGMKAKSTISGVTLVAADDRTDNYADLDGVQIVRGNSAIGDYVNGNASNTDGTSTQVLAAGAAGIKHYITDITIVNTSSSMIYVELKDGTTVKWVFPVPATGGVTHHFSTPLGGTAATAWNFDPSAATTTVYCSVSGFKSKI